MKITIKPNYVKNLNVIKEDSYIVSLLMVKNNLHIKMNGMMMMIKREFIMTKKYKNILTLALGIDEFFRV